jgi:hypothetical protein
MRCHLDQLLGNVSLADAVFGLDIFELAGAAILQSGFLNKRETRIRVPAFKFACEAPIARWG